MFVFDTILLLLEHYEHQSEAWHEGIKTLSNPCVTIMLVTTASEGHEHLNTSCCSIAVDNAKIEFRPSIQRWTWHLKKKPKQDRKFDTTF